jgi:hypothetical protein
VSGAGPDTYRVAIMTVFDDGTCEVRDTLGVRRSNVRYDAAAKGSAMPVVGELWQMDRMHGFWRLAFMIGVPHKPVVTGSRAASDPLSRSLLAAMVSLGLVTDQTSP